MMLILCIGNLRYMADLLWRVKINICDFCIIYKERLGIFINIFII
jgi:hypothetical protein